MAPNKKTSYVVRTEYGTFTRTSHRIYRFIVVSCGLDEVGLERRRKEFLENAEKEISGYQDILDGKSQDRHGLTMDWYRSQVERHDAMIKDVNSRYDALIAEGRKQLSTGHGICHGWSSRRDLAEKLATAVRNEGRHLNVTVVEIR